MKGARVTALACVIAIIKWNKVAKEAGISVQ